MRVSVHQSSVCLWVGEAMRVMVVVAWCAGSGFDACGRGQRHQSRLRRRGGVHRRLQLSRECGRRCEWQRVRGRSDQSAHPQDDGGWWYAVARGMVAISYLQAMCGPAFSSVLVYLCVVVVCVCPRECECLKYVYAFVRVCVRMCICVCMCYARVCVG
jgi:hypothetical protein